jgi:hexosaminidase
MMKKYFLLIIGCYTCLATFAQSAKTVAIIPEPVKTVVKKGQFVLLKQITIAAGSSKGMAEVTRFLKNKLETATGAKVKIGNSQVATIKLSFLKKADATLGYEGYHLYVTKQGVSIKANSAAGLFYGAQTFLQLLPKQIESKELVKHVNWVAPCVDVIDYPRFGWRGLMLDVSRHFFNKNEVMDYIDQMAAYKFNILHMHLTDDEGWRIEIKSLPRLTTVGAFNVKKIGQFGNFSAPTPDEPRNYGGFYTQEDIKELVKYASERFINIMPEIDVPGHSLAAIVSYPELSVTAAANTYQVHSGERLSVDNTLNPSSEKTYAFLDKVLTEVAQLFPFGYVHMGGDECTKDYWAKSDSVTALMKKENLKNYEEVQSYFEKRLETIVESKGKKFMGWDEIIEGGLGPNAAVMSWRGIKGGIIAAKLGHQVVMSPTTYAYLDYMQSDRITEPHVYASLRLNKTYQFDPIPDSVDAKLILGGQANLWTEQVYNFRQVEYMTWPRAMAIAEDVWSPKEKKSWKSFFPKVENHFERLNEAEIKYSPAVYDPSFEAKINADNKLEVELSTEVTGLDIYYSFDNSFPDRFYPKYTEPLIVPKDANQLRIITYKGKQPIGRMLTMPISELQHRADARKKGN